MDIDSLLYAKSLNITLLLACDTHMHSLLTCFLVLETTPPHIDRQLTHTTLSHKYTFLPERDYITFGSLLSQIRLSIVCRLSSVSRLTVTLMHSTQRVKAFNNISSPLCNLAIPDLHVKFYGDRPRGTHPLGRVGRLNARGVAK